MDDARFKAALSRFATGVTIITTRESSGDPTGFTASSLSSLSLDPPMVLFCLARHASCFDAFDASSTFAINILSHGQEELSNRFAQKGENKFEGLAWNEGRNGAPLLEGCLANIECTTVNRVPGGDHQIFVGKVEEARVADGQPLLYYQGKYATI